MRSGNGERRLSPSSYCRVDPEGKLAKVQPVKYYYGGL
jgi:hypothetical protein